MRLTGSLILINVQEKGDVDVWQPSSLQEPQTPLRVRQKLRPQGTLKHLQESDLIKLMSLCCSFGK